MNASRAVRRAIAAASALLTLASAAQAPSREERFTDWSRPVFPAEEYRQRRSAALARLGVSDVLLVPGAEGTSSGENFRQADDFEYFVGLEVPRSVLAIDRAAGRAVLFTPARDPRFDNPGRPNDFPGRPLAADPALRTLGGLDVVWPDDSLGPYLEALERRGARVVINLGGPGRTVEPVSPAFGTRSAGETFAANLAARRPGLVLGNAFELVARLRMTKSAREVDLLRRAARITGEAIARGAGRVRPLVDERTLTGAFIGDCMAQGAQGVPFTPVIKSGDNSLWPWRILGAHYDRRNRRLAAGELVIFDVGCELDHYVSDVGRTFPVSTAFSPEQRDLVDMVRRVSDAAIAAVRPGATLRDLQRAAERAIPGDARAYMQAPLYFGHHLGLDSGDPFLADVALEPGMVFTIEPWYYNHDRRIAVFLEDEVLVTSTGGELLTAGLPRDPAGLERLRRGRGATRPAQRPPR